MPKIAMIDDEPQCCEVVGELVRKRGYDFIGLKNFEEFAEILLKDELKTIDLIILDLDMPEMTINGSEIFKRISPRLKQDKRIPIIIYSAVDGEKLDLLQNIFGDMARYPYCAYISKSEPEKLMEEIEAQLVAWDVGKNVLHCF